MSTKFSNPYYLLEHFSVMFSSHDLILPLGQKLYVPPNRQICRAKESVITLECVCFIVAYLYTQLTSLERINFQHIEICSDSQC
jgi:hypothetical protein